MNNFKSVGELFGWIIWPSANSSRFWLPVFNILTNVAGFELSTHGAVLLYHPPPSPDVALIICCVVYKWQFVNSPRISWQNFLTVAVHSINIESLLVNHGRYNFSLNSFSV